MLEFKRCCDLKTGEEYIETPLAGKVLLSIAQLNKGTAFTERERHEFRLLGKLPPRIETLQEQVARAYEQYSAFKGALERNIYLHNIHDINQVLFYHLVNKHLQEMLPMIYTPIVGTAVKSFSREYRRSRGLYLAYPEADYMEEILDNRSNPEIDLIVVTDGEGVLGIGDQGVGGMDIPIAKLMVYTLCAGIDPTRTMPVQLDVGTNNETLLNDPFYLGLREKRVAGAKYDAFIDKFVSAVKKKFPNAFLHWEDFGRGTARPILDRYKNELCTFNDDIQGTGAVALAAVLAGIKHKKETLAEQRIVVFGAGSAGTGMADQIRDAMLRQGLSPTEAAKRFWLLDQPGLLLSDMENLTLAQKTYARDRQEVAHWLVANPRYINLTDVVANIQPTILIGSSAQPGAFTEAIVRQMALQSKQPIILPLSNPTEKIEARPEQLLEWTDGRVLLATGSPFEPIQFRGKQRVIAQCNNALIFPGLGLGLITAKAKRCTAGMLWAACDVLSDFAPINQHADAPLLPGLEQAREIAAKIAAAVVIEAQREGLAQVEIHADNLEKTIRSQMWEPHYVPYRRKEL